MVFQSLHFFTAPCVMEMGRHIIASYIEELNYWLKRDLVWKKLEGGTIIIFGTAGMIGKPAVTQQDDLMI